ncbi:hypothetical protein EXIGLDRAFT_829867 [Exidia glandulosa HHB12029]|uniref:F-box domain-containing protein n=1 Tax=Exidia glandulosa HHB12029 TaxID=1314781 RepID=A0A165P4S5_EXIGL|nr:hypothetical protein EXIGLDRAFT_829867 [Exidia glandulosa HHB12029]
MTQAARSTLQRRLELDEHMLAAVQAHTAQLETARLDALVALRTVQADLDAIDKDIAQSRARGAELLSSVYNVRSSLQRQQIDTLPLELLREIFLILAMEPDDLWTEIGCGQCNRARSRLPFDLAAVCVRWRQLALAIPPLWSYIGVPAPSLMPRGIYYAHWTRTVLRRSKGSSLDILLTWKDDATWDPRSCASRILDALAQHAHRWRRVEFHVPDGYLSAQTASIFRSPTPRLELFALMRRDDGAQPLRWTPSYPRYLPICPALREFRSDFTDLVLWSSSQQPLQRLVHLEICASLPCQVIWSIIRDAPLLETLILEFPDDGLDPLDFDDPPGAPVALPHLQELCIYHHAACRMFAAAGTLLSMPALECLRTSSSMQALLPILTALGMTVRKLFLLKCELNLEFLPYLRALPNLRELLVSEGTLYDELINALTIPDEWVLPRLQSIHLESVATDPGNGDGLARLVRSRILPLPDANGQTASALAEVSFVGCKDIPRWLIAEVNFLLGRPLEPEDVDEEEQDGVIM